MNQTLMSTNPDRANEPGSLERAVRLGENNFDALRLIFASMVVVYHTGLLSQAPWLAWTQHISSTFAVQAFFVVSGFLVTMSYENSSSLKSYAVKRLRRIAPAYAVVVIGSALGLSMISTMPAVQYFSNKEFWRYIGFNLTLMNFSAPILPGVFESNFERAVNGSLWTIKIEAAFYCVVPLLVFGVRRLGYRQMLAAVFGASLLWKIGFGLASDGTGIDFYSKLAKQLPGQLCFFAGGAWAFYGSRSGKATSGWLALIGILVYAGTEGTLHDAVAPFAVTALVSWAAINAPTLPKVGKYGDFSYGVYLYHFPLVQVFVACGLFQWSAPVATLSIAALVALLAVMSWHFIEEPMLQKRSITREAAPAAG